MSDSHTKSLPWDESRGWGSEERITESGIIQRRKQRNSTSRRGMGAARVQWYRKETGYDRKALIPLSVSAMSQISSCRRTVTEELTTRRSGC